MQFRTPLHAGLVLCAVALAACVDRSPTAAGVPGPAAGRQELSCTVTLSHRQMHCAAPEAPAGVSSNVMLGGQGTYVRLTARNVVVGGGLVTFDVAVQNLLDQRMGTPDGVTASPIRVVFQSGPSAVGGGTVSVDNPDGEADFTGPMQPYFAYAGLLSPGGATDFRQWRFRVTNDVTSFRFSVFVDTEIPSEQGTLRWVREQGALWTGSLNDLWGSSPVDVFGVSNGLGGVLHFDGTRWRTVVAASPLTMRALNGTARENLYAVGDQGVVQRYDGRTWTVVRAPVQSQTLAAAKAVGPATVYAAGWHRNASGVFESVLVRSLNGGASWTETRTAGASHRRYVEVDASPDGRFVMVVGYRTNTTTGRNEGIVVRSTDGGETWVESVLPGEPGFRPAAVWTDGAVVFVTATERNPATGRTEGLILRSDDRGQSWSASGPRTPDVGLYDLGGSSLSRLYAAGDGGTLLSFDGTAWTSQVTDGSSLYAVWASPVGDEVFAGGFGGGMLHRQGGEWTSTGVAGAPVNHYREVTGGPGWRFILAQRDSSGERISVVLRETSAGWDVYHAGPSQVVLDAVWARTPNDAYAVGVRFSPGTTFSEAVIRHWNGSTWSEAAVPNGPERRFYGVWGDGQGRVYAAGTEYGGSIIVMSADGGATWTEVRRTSHDRYFGIWGT